MTAPYIWYDGPMTRSVLVLLLTLLALPVAAQQRTRLAVYSTLEVENIADFKKAFETENKDLKSRVDGHTATARRSEAASFVESYPAEKGKFWLKRRGPTRSPDGTGWASCRCLIQARTSPSRLFSTIAAWLTRCSLSNTE